MALPLQPGLLPSEIAFLCEQELVTVIPRQRLESLELLGGATPLLSPPFAAPLPLWLALLLKRQKRADISPPPWLHPSSLQKILETEIDHAGDAFSPPPSLAAPQTRSWSASDTGAYLDPQHIEPSTPFLESSLNTTAIQDDALPYHWMELSHLLLAHASDDIVDPDNVRRLLRDLREVRMAKIRKGYSVLDAGAGIRLDGVGGLEVAESRAFVSGVVDGLRKLSSSREQARREQEAEDRDNGYEDRDDDML